MNRFFSTICFLFSLTLGFSQKISYTLSMPHPESHYFEVQMELRNFQQDTLELKMPVWAPGSYLVREFSANVNRVKAVTDKNETLEVYKSAKNKWRIVAHKATTILVSYEVYAFELSVRTSFLDLTHGYVNGTSMFLYATGYKQLSGTLEVRPHTSFKKVSTALPKALESVTTDGSFFYQFADYDQLVDSPIEIGNQVEFSFQAAGVHHRVAMYGEAKYDSTRIQKDLAKIVEAETAVFGSNPNKEYLFIVHNVEDGSGGLEHKNSTTLSVSRDVYTKSYNDFLNVAAHEYFHLWNVKRLRPLPLGPFNYDQENYTSLLWFSEGFTSYYADLILYRAGFLTLEGFTSKILSGINYVERSIGNKVQPVADASYDAWIKAYRPNENSTNTTVSYYSKGRIIGATWDAMIVAASNGTKRLDDFMRAMYEKYAVGLQRGFTPQEIETELSTFIHEDASTFFNNYIFDTQPIDYVKYFNTIGFSIENKERSIPYFGTNFQETPNGLYISSVENGSPAEQAGLNPFDFVLTLNDSTATMENWKKLSDEKHVGKNLSITFVRDGLLQSVQTAVGERTIPDYIPKKDKKANEMLFQFWISKSK